MGSTYSWYKQQQAQEEDDEKKGKKKRKMPTQTNGAQVIFICQLYLLGMEICVLHPKFDWKYNRIYGTRVPHSTQHSTAHSTKQTFKII